MKERLLVLAKACPVISQKYEHLVCVAGITDSGEWRRIYPVPWEVFWKGQGTRFKKRMWIEYELESDEPSDHRPESRRLIPDSIERGDEVDISEIKMLLDERLTNLEYLALKGHKEISLGVIKPIITDFVAEDSEYYEKTDGQRRQQTIDGGSAVKIDIPEKDFRYIFNCNPSCETLHRMKCEDWELSELFRACKGYMEEGKYKDFDEVLSKVKDRFYSWMLEKRDPYFIVGTHYKFNSYVIISVIYPPK